MTRKYLTITALLISAIFITGACQSPPPTMIVLVVTATPDGTPVEITSEVTVEVQTVTAELPAVVSPQPTASVPADVQLPTPTSDQIQVAEQVFEGGRMFWVQPTKQIWVMFASDQPGRGRWAIYPDTFVDGEVEFDPSLAAPEGKLQPERGFGKLWRENQDIQAGLGWAITEEFGYISRYEYHPGGEINTEGEYIVGPGYHVLFSLYEEGFRFNEADNSWQLN